MSRPVRPGSTSAGPVTVFLESRFEIDPRGRWRTPLAGESGWGWATAQAVPPVRLAARAEPGTTARWLVEGPTVTLPPYVGVAGAVRALPTLLRRIDAAVRSSRAVSVKLPGIIGQLAVALAVRAEVPVIAHVVGDVGEVLRSGVAGWPGRLAAPLADTLTTAAVRRSDLIRYVTQESLQQRYPAARRATTMAFSDVEVLPAGPRPMRPGRSGRRIISVGSFAQTHKRQDVLIDALRLIRGRPGLGDVELDLVGAGRLLPVLRDRAARAGLADTVHFHGHLADRAELAALLLGADVFVLPSQTEGLPRALIEAMALGLPCVGTRVGGIPELLPDQALVRPGDPVALAARVAEVLSHADLARSLVAAGLATARQFSPERQARRLERWLDAVGTLTGAPR